MKRLLTYGSLKWKYATLGRIYSPPVIGADGTVYAISADGFLYALNPANSSLKWKYATGYDGYSSPAVGADGTIYIGSTDSDNHLYALNPADGSLRWEYAMSNGCLYSPALGADGTIYVGSGDDNLYAISQATQPILSLGKSVNFTSTSPGSVVTYMLGCTNSGSSATNVSLTDTLPPGVSYVPGSAGSNATYNPQTNTLSWSLGTLAYNSHAEVTFQALIAPSASLGSSISNQAEITSTEVTVPVASNSSSFTVGSLPADWWQFHHDAQHTGRSAFDGPSVPSLKWKSATGNRIETSPVIGADGTIYVGSNDSLYAFNPADGSLKWNYTAGVFAATSPALGADGTIYFGSVDGNFYALNPADGSLKWQYIMENPIESSPAIGTDGTIYVGSPYGCLYALNPADGSLKWKSACNYGSDSPTIGTDGTIYVGDGNLTSLNPTDGSVKWQFSVGDVFYFIAPAVGADGTIYVGMDEFDDISSYTYYALIALNAANGSLKWQYNMQYPIESTPAIGADGTIYVGSDDGCLYALNPADGLVKWQFVTGGNFCSSPAIGADGTIYVGSEDDDIFALNAADGSLLWRYATDGCVASSPAIGADGTIYIGSDDGFLYAINQKTQPVLSLSKSVNYISAAPGSAVTYSMTYMNTGSSATNVSLTDVLPAGVSYVPGSAGSTATYNASTNTLCWSLGTLPYNNHGEVIFQVLIDTTTTEGSIINNQAEIASTEVTVPVISNVASLTVGVASRGDWWMFHHDPQHTGRSAFIGPSIPFCKWKYTTGSDFASSAAFGADGTIYIGSEYLDNYLDALDPADGSLKVAICHRRFDRDLSGRRRWWDDLFRVR